MIEGWIVYLFALPLAGFVAWRAGRHGHAAFQVAVRALFVIYLSWVVSAAFFPLPVRSEVMAVERGDKGIGVSLMPGCSTRDYLLRGSAERIVFELAGNVLVFAPFGFLLPLIAVWARTCRRIAAIGLLLSLSIELGQLAGSLALGFSYRVTDIDDIILNLGGVLLGFGIWSVLGPGLGAVCTQGEESAGAGAEPSGAEAGEPASGTGVA